MGMRLRDSQRSKVYKWESAMGFWKPRVAMSWSDCEKLVKAAWSMYGAGKPMPTLHYKPNIRMCYHSPSRGIIVLNRLGMRAETVLHETAHGIIAQRTGLTYEAHGPEWMGVYIDMLYVFMGLNDDDLHAKARAVGIRTTKIEKIRWTHTAHNIIWQ